MFWLILLLLLPTQTGFASAYAAGVMESPVAYHGYDWNDGRFVAVADCSKIGEFVLIRPVGAEKWELHQIADCAGRDAYDENGVLWMTRDNVLVELSYESAQRFGTVEIECKNC